MRVPPSADVWRRIPSWEFHLANVDPGRARTMVGCAQRADSLERLVNRAPDAARAALMSLPGVGEWTAAETAQRAFGDADALSVGDYHLAKVVGWSLLGHPIDDPRWSSCSSRCVRTGTARSASSKSVGCAVNPRFGPSLAIPNLARSRRAACDYRVAPGTRRETRKCEELKDDLIYRARNVRKGGRRGCRVLQKALSRYNDLHLTLKHVHWNVVGPNFIGVHEMIDPQVELVRGYADEVAERIAALGTSPQGTPGAIIKDRTWDDYSVGRDTVQAHLAALDLVYNGVIEDTRKAIDRLGDLDPVSEDMLIGHAGELEKFQWFVRAHLENSGGQLATEGADREGRGPAPRRRHRSNSRP